MLYTGAHTKEISFPLGGIGSGCIGLAGNGRLVDWEIFNKPAKGGTNGFSHFAVKAEAGGRVLDARVLHGDHPGPYLGETREKFTGFGFGARRTSLAGVPHFRSVDFLGEYPFATLTFLEDTFPGAVTLTAFNPLIPLNDADSSIPGAFFSIEIENTSRTTITYTICGVLKNPLPAGPLTTAERRDTVQLLKSASSTLAGTDPAFGDVAIATDAADVSFQQYWYRGAWWDNLQIYWRDLTTPGRFKNRSYDEPPRTGNKPHDDHCVLAAHLDLAPGEKRSVRFVITWNFPNVTNYWNPEPCDCADGQCTPATWKNYYCSLFTDSTQSACFALQHWDRLYRDTVRFKDALFSSTLPPAVLDAVSANISILKSPTVMRLEDGSFYGFEGCHCAEGCCEGSCTHVWNYAYALPFLFPALERSMRDLDYTYNMRFDGKMGFRLQLPLGRPFSDYHAAADGQFGGVIKAYRDWKISGDDAWLRSHWEAIKESIEFAWRRTNEDRWDPQKTGVLQGRQHHTLDTELFGPNSYLTGFYLAALKAAAEMATHFGETATAQEYRALFEKGKAWVDANLFNGEYYHQRIDVKDRSILEPFREADARYGSVEEAYWDAEHGEIKHQIAEGCHVDQVIAQWHANICGLGEIFDPAQVRAALRAIYRHNFKASMRDFFNPCRVFALDDEEALVICDWPAGTTKPAVPLTYAEEAMHGYEYQAAAHMIQEGLIDEGLEVVKAVRDRYDGARRNPWNEIECGSNYARSMASYALLLALSGFEFDLVNKHVGFAPPRASDGFRCFWSLDCAWGIYERRGDRITLRVEQGVLALQSYGDSLLDRATSIRVHEVAAPPFHLEGRRIAFAAPVRIAAGQALGIEVLRAE